MLMRIEIDYIGLIQTAKIDVNSITVIAGNNNTGKSTVGKVLYAVATGLNLLEPSKVLKEKAETIANRLRRINRIVPIDEETDSKISDLYVFLISGLYMEADEELSKEKWLSIVNSEASRNYTKEVELKFNAAIQSKVDGLFDNMLAKDRGNQESIVNLKNDLLWLLNKSIDDDDFKSNIMQKVFDIEFSQQITNVNFMDDDASISIQEINQPEIRLIFNKHKLRPDLSQI